MEMIQPSVKDRRKHPRIEDHNGIAVKIIYRNGQPEKENTIFRLTKDISKEGLCFQTSRTLPLNSELKIHIALREPLKTITHIGNVRWTRPVDEHLYEAGVQFTNAAEIDELIWDHYVDTRLQQLAS